jgi:antitoxin VapB
MQTAKIFMNGKSQAVRLPQEFRFDATEVGVARLGELVVLYPMDTAWENFLNKEPVTDDFAQSIYDARGIDVNPERESL